MMGANSSSLTELSRAPKTRRDCVLVFLIKAPKSLVFIFYALKMTLEEQMDTSSCNFRTGLLKVLPSYDVTDRIETFKPRRQES